MSSFCGTTLYLRSLMTLLVFLSTLFDFRALVTFRPIQIEFEEGCGNVFADLGLADADELYSRAQIGFRVFDSFEEKESDGAASRQTLEDVGGASFKFDERALQSL